MPVPGWRLRICLHGLDALAVEVRRHADVADDDVRGGSLGAGDQSCRSPRPRRRPRGRRRRGEHGPHPFADEDAVVGEEHRDRAHGDQPTRSARRQRGRQPVSRGGASHTSAKASLCTSAVGVDRAHDGAASTPRGGSMRIEARITTVSWIPSEADRGHGQDGGVRSARPPRRRPARRARRRHRGDASSELRAADRFRFANQLARLHRSRRRRPHHGLRLMRRRRDRRHHDPPRRCASRCRRCSCPIARRAGGRATDGCASPRPPAAAPACRCRAR